MIKRREKEEAYLLHDYGISSNVFNLFPCYTWSCYINWQYEQLSKMFGIINLQYVACECVDLWKFVLQIYVHSSEKIYIAENVCIVT